MRPWKLRKKCRFCKLQIPKTQSHLSKFCNRLCFKQWFIKSNNPMWKGGTTFHRGYRYIRINGKYIREHRFIIEKHIGRSLMPFEVVHHINGNKLDNRIENLEILNINDHHKKHYHIDKIIGKYRRIHPVVSRLPLHVIREKVVLLTHGYSRPQYFIGFKCPSCMKLFWVAKDYTKRKWCLRCARLKTTAQLSNVSLHQGCRPQSSGR